MHGRADDSENAFAAALGPHLSDLELAAQTREREALAQERARAQVRLTKRLSEAQLMELIFVSLDADNPRVCEDIDFERIVISDAQEPAEPTELEDAAPSLAHDTAAPTHAAEPTPQLAPPDARAWVGASWSDNLGPIIELVDRPQLSPAQAELLRRAPRGGDLAELGLRHLDRRQALRHLELFIDICQARGTRWCRVITGKGIESSGEPVLKRVVLEWCVAQPPRPSGAARVAAWVPELDVHGEWGALILNLRRSR